MAGPKSQRPMRVSNRTNISVFSTDGYCCRANWAGTGFMCRALFVGHIRCDWVSGHINGDSVRRTLDRCQAYILMTFLFFPAFS